MLCLFIYFVTPYYSIIRLHPTIKFTCSFCPETVNFLDTTVHLINIRSKLNFTQNPRHPSIPSFQLLPPTSHNQKYFKKSSTTYQTRSPTTAYFEKHAACLTSYLVSRSYKEKHIRKIIDEVRTIPRKNLIKSTPKSASKKTPFITTFHLRLPKFNSIFNKFNNLLSEDSCLKAIFPKRPITTYRRYPTLRDILVKSTLKSTCTTFFPHEFFHRNRHNCSIGTR